MTVAVPDSSHKQVTPWLAVLRLSGFGTSSTVAVATAVGSRAEGLLRGGLRSWTEWVADLYGMSSRRTVTSLIEQLAALEYRLEQLEKRETAPQDSRA